MEQYHTSNLISKSNSTLNTNRESDHHFSYSLIKGKIAEEIVHRLFAISNYNVYQFGMENTIPGVLGTLKKEDATASRIRSMPDFIIQEPNSNHVFFIEVKYRKDGNYQLDKRYENYAYGETFFIIVSKTEFRIVSYTSLSRDKRITKHNSLPLNSLFKNIDKKSEEFFLEMTAKFYDGVD